MFFAFAPLTNVCQFDSPSHTEFSSEKNVAGGNVDLHIGGVGSVVFLAVVGGFLLVDAGAVRRANGAMVFETPRGFKSGLCPAD